MQFDCKKFDRTWRIRICVGHGEGRAQGHGQGRGQGHGEGRCQGHGEGRGQGHGEGRGGEKKASSLVHNAMIKGGPRKIF